MRLIRALLTLALLSFPSLALAQGTIINGGAFTAGHLPMYVQTGQPNQQAVVQDSGPASGGGAGVGISELLRVVRGTGSPPFANGGTGPLGTNDCNYDAPTNNPTGYHFFCTSPNAQGGALIATGAAGGAANIPFNIIVNGITYPFPGSLSQIIVNTTPVSGGSNGSCLFVNGTTVGQQTCSLSSITALTGDVTATGPGSVAATLATVNPNVGTFGSSTLVPVITTNGKGLITAITTTSLTVNANNLTGTVLAAGVVNSSLQTLGTISTGVWNGSIVQPAFGGTGVNNGTNTLTLSGNLATAGSATLTLTVTAPTNVTLPTGGTLVNSAVTTLSSLSTVGTITTGTWQATILDPTYGGTGVNNAGKNLTLGASIVTTGTGAPTLAFSSSANTYTFPNATDTIVLNAAAATLTNKTFSGGTFSGTIAGTPTFSGANFILLGNLVQDGTPWSLFGNATSAAANYAPFTIGSLNNKASPAGTDLVVIQDQAAGGALKNATVSSIAAGSTVASVNTLTGALVIQDSSTSGTSNIWVNQSTMQASLGGI